jgi:protein-disulfide isomerase
MFDIFVTNARRQANAALLAPLVATALVACQAKPGDNKIPTGAAKVVAGATASASGMCSPGLSIAPSAAVAKIGETVITCAELYEANKAAVTRAESEFAQQVHQIHQGGLQQLIDDRLIEAAAKKAGKSKDDYFKEAVKVEPPTDQEMQALYDGAKARGQQLPPFEEVKGDIVTFLTQQKTQQARGDMVKKLRDESKVETMLPPLLPPKVEVEALGPSKGPAGAPVTIVEFSDFECPYCSRAEPTVSQVLATYGDKVRLVYRDYPLPMHSNAPKASEAALCAEDQGKYWEMHAKLFEKQRELQADKLAGYAQEVGLDMAKFNECMTSGAKAAVIAASTKAGEAAGVSGTPAFFINGRMLSGAQPFERFKEIIDHELKEAGAQ